MHIIKILNVHNKEQLLLLMLWCYYVICNFYLATNKLETRRPVNRSGIWCWRFTGYRRDKSVLRRNFRVLVCFLPCCVASRILVPGPGIEPGFLAVEAQSPNYWATREFPRRIVFNSSVEALAVCTPPAPKPSARTPGS